ncbi:MAG: hypothetical protein BWX79_02546 [Alphaproteobacteria bacterium ADurb.Bin100]|nr:MAG: hypothetical protein BWX79_02546 [Alphaproteobacteria bacterium ADurb.Bin100]
MSTRFTKKSLLSRPSRSVKTPSRAPSTLAPSTRRPPTSTVISGALSVSSCARSSSISSGATRKALRRQLRKPSACGSSTAKEATSVCASVASVRPGVNGTSTTWPAAAAADSTPALPASTIRSASDTCLPPVCAALNALRTPTSTARTRASCAGWFTAQSFCGARRMRAPLAPPRLSLPRKVEAEAQAVETSSGTLRPLASTFAFNRVMSPASISGWSTAGSGSCQTRSSAGTSGPR